MGKVAADGHRRGKIGVATGGWVVEKRASRGGVTVKLLLVTTWHRGYRGLVDGVDGEGVRTRHWRLWATMKQWV